MCHVMGEGFLSAVSYKLEALCSTHCAEIHTAVLRFHRGRQQVRLFLCISCYFETFSVNQGLLEGKEAKVLETLPVCLMVPEDFVIAFVIVTAGDVHGRSIG